MGALGGVYKQESPHGAGFQGCFRSCGNMWKRVCGAGEGNRTLVMSLGSSGNAIIRRPLRGAFLPEGLGEMKGGIGFFWRAGEKGSDLSDLLLGQRSIPAGFQC